MNEIIWPLYLWSLLFYFSDHIYLKCLVVYDTLIEIIHFIVVEVCKLTPVRRAGCIIHPCVYNRRCDISAYFQGQRPTTSSGNLQPRSRKNANYLQ